MTPIVHLCHKPYYSSFGVTSPCGLPEKHEGQHGPSTPTPPTTPRPPPPKPQPELFRPARPRDILGGRSARDRGVELVDGHMDPVWSVNADREILRRARTLVPFNADHIAEAVGMPERPQSMGARFLAAAKRGLIVRAGYTQMTRKQAHARHTALWMGTSIAEQGRREHG